MSAILIPSSTVQVRLEDASLDLVCFEYAREVLGDARQAGKLAGYVEATLTVNPGIADSGAILPLGMTIVLPEFVIDQEQPLLRLWD